ncbi:MAG: hypothetical protein Q9170_003368 [Blastenia crenularia]
MDWPRSPNLQGRPLDTALLLHRDYVASFCNHIYQHRARGSNDLVPLAAFLPLLQSTTSVGHVLANRVDGLQNGFDTFSKIQQAIDCLNDQSRSLQYGREMLGPYRVEREDDPSVEVKEELQSVNPSESGEHSPGSGSDRRHPSTNTSRSSGMRRAPRYNDERGTKVTIKIRDPAARSRVRECSHDMLMHLLEADMHEANIKIPVHSVHVLNVSGDVRVVTSSSAGAKAMRNPRKWKPSAGTSALVPQNSHVREFPYDVPGTNTVLDFVVFLENPIERQALEVTILRAIQWILNRLDKGDSWLDKKDDPFVSAVPGRCYIQIMSKKTSTGRSRMTYRTLLSVFKGLWHALYIPRLDFETCLRIQVAGLLAGFGFVRVEDVPLGLTAA